MAAMFSSGVHVLGSDPKVLWESPAPRRVFHRTGRRGSFHGPPGPHRPAFGVFAGGRPAALRFSVR